MMLSPFVRTFNRPSDWLFYGWFGPIGVAAVFYSSAMHESGLSGYWQLTSLIVLASAIVHGVTATPGAGAMARGSH